MKNNKEIGVIGMSSEVVKLAGEALVDVTVMIIEKVEKGESIQKSISSIVEVLGKAVVGILADGVSNMEIEKKE